MSHKTTKFVTTVPEGSVASDVLNQIDAVETVVQNELDSLGIGQPTTALSYSNPHLMEFANLIIFLKNISPTENAKIAITNGIDEYELPVSTAQSAKSLYFTNLPTTFLSNFYIVNKTGTILAPHGNCAYVSISVGVTIPINPLEEV